MATGNNDYVIEAFINKRSAQTPLRNIINGYYQYKGRTLTTDGHKLVNYTTTIAIWRDDKLVAVDMSKYSNTTTRIQYKLKYALKKHGISFMSI